MADVTASAVPTRSDGRPLKGRILTGYLRFVERLDELGATLLEPHWLGSINPHRVRCAAGHDCAPRPGDVSQGQGICRICVGMDPAAAEARFRARLDELGATLLEPRWLGALEPHKARCAAGHECTPRPSNMSSGQGICRVCAGQDPAAAEARFRARVAELGGMVLGQYVNKDIPVLLRCANGHDCAPRPGSVVKGFGLCRTCAGQDPITAEARFRARIEELGGTVLGEYVSNRTPIAARCSAGHDCNPYPNNVMRGEGFCLTCIGVIWDVFYVVTGPAGVKFGITSGNPRPRLAFHRRNGYGTVVRVHEGLPGTTARDLENELVRLMCVSGVAPVRGREYFPAEALPTILHVVDERLGDTGGELIVDDAA